MAETKRWYRERPLNIVSNEERKFIDRSISLERRKIYYVFGLGLVLIMAGLWNYIINISQRLYRDIYEICEVPSRFGCDRYSIQKVTGEKGDGYLLGFAEINDMGMPMDNKQHSFLIDKLYEIASKDPVMIVVYIHGWHHNAAPGDASVESFKSLLKGLSRLEAERKYKKKIIGVYIGWNGESISIPALNSFTIFHQSELAVNMGRGITGLLMKLEEIKKGRNSTDKKGHLIVIGDSLGANAAFAGLYQIFMARMIEQSSSSSSISNTEVFGDLVIFRNPTFEAIRYYPLFDIAQSRCSYSSDQTPKLMLLTSETDNLQYSSSIGRFFSSLLKPSKNDERSYCDFAAKINVTKAGLETIGAYYPFVTHMLKPSQGNTYQMLADISNLWPKQMTGGKTKIGSTILTHLNKTDPRNPLMNIRVDRNLMNGHNDLYGLELNEFIISMISLSTSDSARQDAE